MSIRSDKVRLTLKKAVSEIIKIEHNFDYLVSVSDLDISPDLSNAKIYISVLGDQESKEKVIDELNDNSFNIKNYFSKYIKLRKIPSIHFFIDETIENAEKMQNILDNLN
jgi:ribosome-binding factor A